MRVLQHVYCLIGESVGHSADGVVLESVRAVVPHANHPHKP